MKHIKLIMIVMAAILIALPRFDSVYARGGGGHGGGGWGGGGHGGGRNEHNNNFHRGNDWGWGAADGAIAGLAAGAIIADENQPPTIIVEQQSDNTEQQSASGSTAYGTQVTVLPPGSVARNVNGTVLYECGSVWYKPYFGSNGVYYEVVPPPPAGNQ